MDTFLLIVKYAAAALSGAYGVYATLTDFHEQKNGKRVLSKTGRLGILFLVTIAVLGLSSDALKDIKEKAAAEANNKQEREDREKQVMLMAQTRDTLVRTKAISSDLQNAVTQIKWNSNQTARLLDPLQLLGSDMSATFLVDPDWVPASWLDRIESRHSSFGDRDFPSDQYSEEKRLARLLKGFEFTVWIVEKGEKPEFDRTAPKTFGLAARGWCGSKISEDGREGLEISIMTITSESHVQRNQVKIDCATKLTPPDVKSGDKVRSYLDLIGSTLFLQFGHYSEFLPDDKPVTPVELNIRRADGRSLRIHKFNRIANIDFKATIGERDLR